MLNNSLVEPADFLGSGIVKGLVNDQIGSTTIFALTGSKICPKH
jgi:hypothetical protein